MFRNRGKLPNIRTGNHDNKGNHYYNNDYNNNYDNNYYNDDDYEGGYSAPHYSNYWNGRFIILRYDKFFIAIELVTTLIVLMTVFAVYIFGYKVTFEDPIAELKENYLTAELITIVVTVIITGLVTFFTRSSKENLIKNLRIIIIASIFMTMVLLGTKLYIDSNYNEETFGEFYEQYVQTTSKNNSNKVSIGLSGVKILDSKEAYIEESVKAYTHFTAKTMVYLIMYILVIVVIIYLTHRLSTIEKKKERLRKDDAVLYDEEENIKI